jgi:hypothetical protein
MATRVRVRKGPEVRTRALIYPSRAIIYPRGDYQGVGKGFGLKKLE